MTNERSNELRGTDSASRDSFSAGRRRMIRNILVGTPAIMALSASSAYASSGSGYGSTGTNGDDEE